MEPAASVIKKLGGPAEVAAYLKTSKNVPYRWTYPRDRDGTGGVIPHWHHENLLKMAEERGIFLTRAELVLAPQDAAPAEQGSAA